MFVLAVCPQVTVQLSLASAVSITKDSISVHVKVPFIV